MMGTDKTIISCKRKFAQSPERLFAAFTDPAQVKQWFGPKEFSIGEVRLVPEINGSLEIEMINPRGDRLWVRGKYTEMIPGIKIAYTFAYEPDMPNLGETLVTIHFDRIEEGTEVSLVHTIFKAINPDGRAKGWEDGFDKMAAIIDVAVK